MIVIGEKLNSSVPKTFEAFNNGDEKRVVELIKKQAECGADYLDINTALTGVNEIKKMLWVTGLALENSSCGIMLDSPNPDVAAQCIPLVGKRKIIVNSITAEDKFNELISVVKEYNTGIVCLPIVDKIIPQSAEERLEYAGRIIDKLRAAQIPDSNIYIDVLVEAVSTNEKAAVTALKTITLMNEKYPGIKTICGLSNISFGMPGRANLNASFLTMAAQSGLNAVIADITSEQIQNALITSNAILGKDEYCLDYIEYFRSQKKK